MTYKKVINQVVIVKSGWSALSRAISVWVSWPPAVGLVVEHYGFSRGALSASA